MKMLINPKDYAGCTNEKRVLVDIENLKAYEPEKKKWESKTCFTVVLYFKDKTRRRLNFEDFGTAKNAVEKIDKKVNALIERSNR